MKYDICSVDPIEVFLQKLSHCPIGLQHAIYTILFNLQKYRLFDESQEAFFKKCIMYYSAIASEVVPERFDLPTAQGQVEKYLKGILLPEGNLAFWTAFAKGEYKPELPFGDSELLARIERHPMALWKCGRKTQGQK